MGVDEANSGAPDHLGCPGAAGDVTHYVRSHGVARSALVPHLFCSKHVRNNLGTFINVNRVRVVILTL